MRCDRRGEEGVIRSERVGTEEAARGGAGG